MMRYVDLIVPIYRNANLVRACIDSLLENLEEIADRSPRMILVNDSPDDVPVAALLNEPALQREDVVVLANEQNLGFVKSVNRALAEALKAGRDVVLVNSDTITFPGTLRNLLNAVAQDPQIGFASPRSNNASLCSLPHSYGGVPPRPDEAFDRWQRISRSMPAWHFSPTAVGFFMYISHSVLANHGLLSEEFGPGYEEENDLVMRAGKVGRRAILVNHAFAFHAGSASFALYDLDLDSHRKGNLERMTQVHLEFLPLVKRYEGSAHFRAEQLLTGLLPELDGRSRLVFDLTGLGQHHNGTNEHAIAVVRQFVRNWSDRFRVSGIGDVQSFRFHGLDKLHGLHRVDPANPGLHAIAIRIAQPFDLHHVNVMERLAPINVYAMLDTITEDCGPLSVESEVPDLWNYVANHANGLLFNSRFAEQQFCTRHTAARLLPRMARLLSTDNRDYRTKGASKGGVGKHILVLGNHFPHKGTEPAVQRLRAAFPTLKIVAVGGRAYWDGSVTGFKSGEISADIMRTLFEEASAVVLPSHVEGFGFGLMHAIAAGKPIAARRIGATEEILAAFRSHHGIFLFDTDAEMSAAVSTALYAGSSEVSIEGAVGWEVWAAGVGEMAAELLASGDVFNRIVRRIEAGDSLRMKDQLRHRSSTAESPECLTSSPSARSAPLQLPPKVGLDDLMAMQSRAFVENAYALLLGRLPDDGGLAHYFAAIEGGTARLDVLRDLANSAESRAFGAELPGLTERLASQIVPRPASTNRQQTRLEGSLADLSLEDVLARSGADFIDAAYAFVLGRAPDDQGRAFYAAEVEGGAPKESVIRALVESPEAKARHRDFTDVLSRINGRSGSSRSRLRSLLAR